MCRTAIVAIMESIIGIELAIGLLFSLELFLVISRIGWKFKEYFATLLIFFYSFASGIVLFGEFSLGRGLFLIVLSYQIVGLIRIVQGQLNQNYQKIAAFQTSSRLIFAQLALALLFSVVSISYPVLSLAAVVIQLIAAIVILLAVTTSVRKSQFVLPDSQSKLLPTVTIAIPARNETEALAECLEQWIASTYPKLEILVLDDCSRTKRAQLNYNLLCLIKC